MTLEDTLRDLAKRGEITHISLTPSAKGWRASFSPSSITGASFGEDRDPVNRSCSRSPARSSASGCRSKMAAAE